MSDATNPHRIHVWYADGAGSPTIAPADAVELAGLDTAAPRTVTLGFTVDRHPWLDDLGRHESSSGEAATHARTVLAGYALHDGVNDGRIEPLPVRLSAVPAMIERDPPDVAVLSGVRRGGSLAFGRSVGWADVLARRARAVVVEIDTDDADLGGPEIEGPIVATIARPADGTGDVVMSRAADDVDLRIGELVRELLPDAPTLQFGPGGVGEGIASALDRPVRIWSGLVTDAMAGLHERGLLLAPAVAAYTWGGAPVRRLATDGMLRLASSTVTHDLTTLSAIPRFVGCNTALQVGLDGSVNVERIGDRVVAAVGGHPDFCVGASRSPGGLSIVALRSTTPSGESTVVRTVDVVSTARSDVDVVVTEHGVADLRGLSDRARGARLVEVAAPEHRSRLAGT